MNRIKELRDNYNITQVKLAEACDLSYQTIQRYETGSRLLNTDKLRIVAEGFTKLGFPTKPSELLPIEDQAFTEDQELSSKIAGLQKDLRKQHDDFLQFLMDKQKDNE